MGRRTLLLLRWGEWGCWGCYELQGRLVLLRDLLSSSAPKDCRMSSMGVGTS